MRRREAQVKGLADVSIEEFVPPEPIYDDESFREWYRPDEMTRWEDILDGASLDGASLTPEEATAADEEFARPPDPCEREAFLMYVLYGVPLPEMARAFGMSVAEASRLSADARRRVGVVAGGRIL